MAMLTATDEARREEFVGRLFEATLGAFDLLTIQLGLELGLYAHLAEAGSASPPELAARAGIDARYAREWLEQQAVSGILEVDDLRADEDDRRYSLPAPYAEVLLEPDSPYAGSAMPRSVASGAAMIPALVGAFRTGGGVAWADYPGLVAAQELANRPMFRNALASEWLPAIPDIHARLTTGPTRIADLACGAGWSTIALAEGFPLATVDGIDVDPESIERAERNAADSPARDRITFHLVDAGSHDLDGRYDLVTIFEALHDMSRPVEVLAAARALLAPGGALVIADEKVAEEFVAPGDEIERVMYGYSVLMCLANGRVESPSAATGTVLRPSTLRRYAADAGYGDVTILPIEHETFRFYRLDP